MVRENENTIRALSERLEKLKHEMEDSELMFFGFDTETHEKLSLLQKELRALVRERSRLISRLNAINDTETLSNQNRQAEFAELAVFFPETELKALEDIESFHSKLRRILGSEAAREINRLTDLISSCDTEIAGLRESIKNSGLAREMSERTLSQCITVTRTIDRLKEENEELLRQYALQQARNNAEKETKDLLSQQTSLISEITDRVNRQINEINGIVTEGRETAPRLYISEDKAIRYGTEDNISEGTAFKSLVIYDLAMAALFPVPYLIHDSNIIKRLGNDCLEHILQCYQSLGRQVFIAFDKAGSVTDTARQILEKTAVLTLDDGRELYGRSWTKKI